MGSKYSRKNQSRPPKPPSPPKRQRSPLPEIDPGVLEITAIAHEDSVLPVKLKFPPPLAELAGDKKGFDYNWQLLTYAFELPNPLDIPPFETPFDAVEMRKLSRFLEVCEKVAGYSVVNMRGGITWKSNMTESTWETVTADDEVLVGFSVRFRQLHDSDSGDPCYETVSGILMKAARLATDDRAEERMEILKQWSKARGKLLNHPLKHIVAAKVLANEGHPNPSEFANYRDVDPQKLISLFNDGEKIHHGKHADAFDELAQDQFKHDHAEHEFIVSMLGLVHLYFGYSQVIRAAAGFAYVREELSA
ncbi:hypothetical protein R1X32_01050 (plasmid) [Rhodococcus opacus]|uniref:hypothetical protein n=1 Tax=Rhodococcus opacus TaxID=37919 RepID=UPI0034D2D49A